MTPEGRVGTQQAAMRELHLVTTEYAARGAQETKALAGLMVMPWMLVWTALLRESVGWGFVALSCGAPLAMALWGFLASHTLPLGTVKAASSGSVGLTRVAYAMGCLVVVWDALKLARGDHLSPLGLTVALAVLAATVALGWRGRASRTPELLALGTGFMGMLHPAVAFDGTDRLAWYGLLLAATIALAIANIRCRLKLRSLYERMSALRGTLTAGGMP